MDLSPREMRLEKGLVHLVLDAAELLAAMARGVPIDDGACVQEVRVGGLTPRLVADLAASPILDGPAVVVLNANWRDGRYADAIQALAESPGLRDVRQLCLVGGKLLTTDRRLAALRKRFGPALRLRQPGGGVTASPSPAGTSWGDLSDLRPPHSGLSFASVA